MVRIIDVRQIARKKVLGEKVIFVEISSLSEYQKLQLAGALHVPLERLKQLAPQYLPNRGSEIVVYGPPPTGTQESDALIAARQLDEMGYGNVYFYPGGKGEWTRLGYDIESAHFPPLAPTPPPTVAELPPGEVKAA